MDMQQSLSTWLSSMPDKEVRGEALFLLAQMPNRPWEEIAANAGFNVCLRRKREVARLEAENARLRSEIKRHHNSRS